MGKIAAGAAELERTLAMSPMDFLSHSIYRTKPCTKCEGQGFLYQQNGPDDADKEECRACNGSGRVIL
jgi:DnaJ-class molecular chaperone